MGKPRDNPPRTAEVLRDFIAQFRAEGHDVISLIDLELAVEKLEANNWHIEHPPKEEDHDQRDADGSEDRPAEVHHIQA